MNTKELQGGPHVLPQTGTYVLRVGEINSDHVGSYSFQLVAE